MAQSVTRYLDLDFETRSACDLKKAGADRYAQDPSTEILTLAYFMDGWARPEWWRPGEPVRHLAALCGDPDTMFVAHNAAFEQSIWRHLMMPVYGFPEMPAERWECTLAACAWKSLPLKLERVVGALRLPAQKDMEGNRLTLSLSRYTKKTGEWPVLTPDTQARVDAYCAADVVAEVAVKRRIGLLSTQSQHERIMWLHDQRMNQRGLRIDLDFVRQAQLVVDRASRPLREEFRELTGGINPTQRDKVLGWVHGQGVELDNLQKGTIETLLGETEDDQSLAGTDDEEARDLLCVPAGLPLGVRRVLGIRQMLGSASVKKLGSMRACVGHDGRARGLIQYHAAHTGRDAGRILQPQNFPRGTVQGINPQTLVEAILTGDPAYVEAVTGKPAIEAVASGLRHALVPDPGHVFVCGDFAGIEARIVLALAGQHDKTALMASGHDVYFDMAEAIYNRPAGTWAVEDKAQLALYKKAYMAERTIGKFTVLGCGFGMGPAKFHARYCPEQPFEFAQTVIRAYRKEWAPKVPDLWYALEDAALQAVATGRAEDACGVTFRGEDGFLVAHLPSGWQRLWYFEPKWHENDHAFRPNSRFNKPMWTYRGTKNGKWCELHVYGGLLTENIVQALARGLLCAAVCRVEQAGMPVVLKVHDEIVVEVPEDQADEARFSALMAQPSKWASDLRIPIAVETWQGGRYKK